MIDGKDELVIIQEDIRRAAAKPDANWAMLIDLRRCTSCKACTAGCVAEQKSPPGIIYRPVYEEESGKFPKVKRRFAPRPCNQCDNPPCVAVCPKKGEGGATWKGKKGTGAGIVMIDYEQCIGCGKCVPACPYKARALDGGAFFTEATPTVQAYEHAPSWEYGKQWPREKGQLPIGKARKCHFCLHRLKQGMVPMCVSTCPCRAGFFGDPDDAKSLIHRMMKENRVSVLASVKAPYPGKTPVFAAKAPARPRVFYILPE
ncbi:MAG TPA: 4Fe-4S dicluster domain-containing protein [Candidatus Deferrimicrobiaceae bacterium]